MYAYSYYLPDDLGAVGLPGRLFFLYFLRDGAARLTLGPQVGLHGVTTSQIVAGENHVRVHLAVVGAALGLFAVWAVCSAVLLH